MAADVEADNKAGKPRGLEAKAQAYVGHLNLAFRVMKIDTVEAQAVYLAHAFIESDQFRQFTETQGAVDKGAQKWKDEDPASLKRDTGDLKGRYENMKSVNAGGNYEFIGRGPVQVTHRAEYVESIAMIEKTGEMYEAQAETDPKAKEMAELCRNAAKDIKADPNNAAKPEYTFLFSAATMKRMGADVSAGKVKPGDAWTGVDPASGWVAGNKQKEGSPQALALIDKKNAYGRIHPILMREAKAWEAAQKAKEQAPAETPKEVEPDKPDIYEPTEI